MWEVQKFTEKHAERDNRVASYLEDLDAARPMEGQTVIHAFKLIAQDVENLKKRIQAQFQSMQEHTSNVKDYILTGASKGMTAQEQQACVAM